MAKINFHEIVDRTQTASVKWGLMREIFGAEDLLPMWVADMDVRPPAEVQQAIKERLDHGLYGYTYVPPSTGDSLQTWLNKRHGWDIRKSWILYSPGVVPSISIALQAYTEPSDKVLIQSPVYTPFSDLITMNDRVVINSPLHLKNGRLEINFEDFEEKLKSGVKLFLLCSPHNPGGTVWNKEELIKIGELCKQYNCLILSDEIHSDIVFPPNQHYPLAALKEDFKDIVLTCVAPSKTFNLAGLQASAVIIENKSLREKFQAVQHRQGFFTLNTFGIIGMEAAYGHGEEWLDQLLVYLKENVEIARQFIEKNLPNIEMVEPEGTYLLWLDCSSLGLPDSELAKRLIEVGKLALEPGPKYGPGGEGFVRMNIACPRELLIDGLNRLKKALG